MKRRKMLQENNKKIEWGERGRGEWTVFFGREVTQKQAHISDGPLLLAAKHRKQAHVTVDLEPTAEIACALPCESKLPLASADIPDWPLQNDRSPAKEQSRN
ncbi:unnamed protein product [Dovyalis caffra]|uniref:Uncharacterized protein n=1 Tax=Dovyalis caffra TaxID=77055 RepID=A0AAV1SAB6_9ROSI|nr:unnamed protein product [Dovyalis caffra]